MCLADLHIEAALLRARTARRRIAWRRSATVAAALVALVPIACGDDDEPIQATAPAVTGTSAVPGATRPPSVADADSAEPIDDEGAITSTLESLLTGAKPQAACRALVTEGYVKRSYGDQRGCTAAVAAEKPADRVKVTEVVVLPDGVAQARVGSSGGVYDGQRLRAELVLDMGLWKVDRLRSNVPVGP